jgi:exopolysaccharide production protein ExoQ
MRGFDTEFLNRKCISGMPKFINRAQSSTFSGMGLSGGLLAIMPLSAIAYILLVLPFIPEDGNARSENRLFWPVAAALTLAFILQNRARIDYGFWRSLPILSLIAYLLFAAASVSWAYSPEDAFVRLAVQVLATVVIVAPYALPIRTDYTIQLLHVCLAVALAISAVYVMVTPSSPIGHAGYFLHKQQLGQLCASAIILSSHEVLFGGWRRLLGIIAACVGVWLIVESQSKTALAFSFVAMAFSWLILFLCKKLRTTPAYIVAAIVVASMFISNPIERIAYRLYGDSTITGRTEIWAFIGSEISQKPWLGWGFHSYYFVPNPPIQKAGGYVAQMPSSHSGYLELKLETGMVGYWIFLISIYATLHGLERVRRTDPARAWVFLSSVIFALLINLTDSSWFVFNTIWIIYLIVVAETVRYSWPRKLLHPRRAATQPARSEFSGRPLRTTPSAS